ncbi:MAG: CPBP family intramembrane metalloprotease [Paludibacteraceae bacterium]|nr:CPBP family intramembrane metalloprotease [Paludibacteraceae bacterium]
MQKVLHIVEWLGIMAILALMSIGIWALAGGGQSVAALKWLQVGQTLSVFVLPPILCALWWYKKDWKSALGLSTKRSFSDSDLSTKWSASAAVLLIILASPGISLLSYWNQSITFPPCLAELESSLRAMEDEAADLILLFAKADNVEILIVNLFVMAILPAFGEELTFRGLLFSFFKKENSQLSTSKLSTNKLDGYSTLYTLYSTLIIWISAIIFSAVHMQFFGFIPRMLLGALFGYVFVWSGNLWLPIVMHLTNNAFAVLMYNIFDWCGKDPSTLDTFGTGDTLWVGILSLILTGVGIYFLRKLLIRARR